MKIAVASDDRISISNHFGRTKGFMVFNLKDNKIEDYEYRVNDFTGHARNQHDEAVQDKHSTIVDHLKDCQVIVTRGMGQRLYDDLKNADVEVYITNENGVDSAVEQYINDELDNNPDKSCSPENH